MHHAVTYGTNLVETADHAFLRICEHFHHLTYSLFMIGHLHGDCLFRAIGQLEFEE